jgi:hypothetical protein
MAKQTKNYAASGSAFFGCMILGVGVGALFDSAGAGWLIGTGIGFLVMAFLRAGSK